MTFQLQSSEFGVRSFDEPHLFQGRVERLSLLTLSRRGSTRIHNSSNERSWQAFSNQWNPWSDWPRANRIEANSNGET
jgi:hypothetical protein